ncbi:MAG: RelA/SpoT family protein [Bacteroidales bacterium]|jgi:GTP pyrophosphokinase|nr:RelA/SpoT family protein [Bacteroidales bacterium]
MDIYIPNPTLERKTILKKYRDLCNILPPGVTKQQRKLFHKAFSLAVDAHKDMRRKGGEPYVYHPVAVAEIVAQEINLGVKSMISALLHDVVEDTDFTFKDIRGLFGEDIAKIVDGLTKIEDIVVDVDQSVQAENFRKILLSTVEDVRVILIKLADRLHNMRTLNAMPQEKQWKISSETTFFFVPIAHRLGLYTIKSELEDLAMKYNDPTEYNKISYALESTAEERKSLIDDFTKPVIEKFKELGIEAEITSRTKSVYSIHQKMMKKKISFEDIYDIFAVRFVFDSPPEEEKIICWRIHTIITEMYKTNQLRERNFITNPKPNGYQSLHLTAMSKAGKWVEVQIRSKRMNEISEKGLAAHFKYKEENKNPQEYENRVEEWLTKIRHMLKSEDTTALELLDEVKLNLNLKEVIVFTPKGERRVLPAGATVLDFAYDLHTNLGNRCIGAKVNYNIVPIDYVLRSGDQLHIITSKKQIPKPEWFNYVKTTHSREKIKEALRDENKKKEEQGKKILAEIFTALKIENTASNIGRVQADARILSPYEFWNNVAEGVITKDRIRKIFRRKNTDLSAIDDFRKKISNNSHKGIDILIDEQLEKKPEAFLLDEISDVIRYNVAECCNPIPGDQVVGFQITNDSIEVHQTKCPVAIEQMSKFGNRIIKAKWRKESNLAFLSGIRITGFDKKGMLKEIIDVVSSQMELNIRSLDFWSKSNTFNGKLMVYIQNVKALNELIENLYKIDQVEKVERIAPE